MNSPTLPYQARSAVPERHGTTMMPAGFALLGLLILTTTLPAQAPRTPQRILSFGRGAPPSPDSTTTNTPAPQGQPAQRGPAVYMNVGFSGLMDFGWSSEPNVRALQPGDHDPAVRGFTVPNEELTLDGAVDPYFKGFVNVVYKIDEAGESALELEEAYVQTTSLPANLQVKAGQFLTDFGRQNAQHPHAWAFVDQPLVLNRMFGADGMRGQGARLSWLVPTSFYTEVMVTFQNSFGETMHSFQSETSTDIHGGVPAETEVKSGGDLMIAPRLATSFDLTSTQTLLLGISGAFGPNNSGPSQRTSTYGLDAYWRWKSATAGQGFPFFSLQAEVIGRQYEAAARTSAADPTMTLPAETIDDGGWYAQALWGIKPRVVAGLRAEAVGGDPTSFTSEARADRFRLSPNFTWYPSEFSKIRLQYNYDDRKDIGRDHSLWLQFEFTLGAHAAHRF